MDRPSKAQMRTRRPRFCLYADPRSTNLVASLHMLNRLVTRLIWSAITLLGTAVLTFFLMNAVPGDPATAIAGSKASAEVLAQVRQRYLLDQPAWKRLGHHLGRVVQGDLGHSYVTEQPVAEALRTRFATTATLAGLAVVFWMLLAIPAGVMTARFRGSWFDRGVLVLATVGISLPSFWLARMMQYLFAYKLGWFPVAGFRGLGNLVLPALALATLAAGYYARLIHTNMVEVLDSPYVRTARAKGLNEWAVLIRHGLRNAFIPVMTVLGMDVAYLLGGVLFVENVFALPGIGTLAVQSVFNLDVPMIMGTVLFSGAMVVSVNLMVDLLYGWVDPRIRSA
jgi:peptide/nickel transport system permease protein